MRSFSKQDEYELRALSMPRGFTLYHGTTESGFDVLRGPAWVTDDPGTAKKFLQIWRSGKHKGSGKRHILEFQTTHKLHLLDISEPGGIPVPVVKHYLGSGTSTRGGISSYDLASALCEEGIFDGWVCDVGCLWKDAAGADIMICRPKRSLIRVDDDR